MEHEVKLIRRNIPEGLTETQKKEYNISIPSDNVFYRYATYNENCILKGWGDECKYITENSDFILHRGMIAIQGDAAEITSNIKIQAGNTPTKMYWVVYAEINRSIATVEKAKIITISQIGNYAPIPPSDDLTNNPQGVARSEVYRFTAINGTISDVEERMSVLDYGVHIRSENNILKTEQYIIPKKQLLWSGAFRVDQNKIGILSDVISYDRDGNFTYEIWIESITSSFGETPIIIARRGTSFFSTSMTYPIFESPLSETESKLTHFLKITANQSSTHGLNKLIISFVSNGPEKPLAANYVTVTKVYKIIQ